MNLFKFLGIFLISITCVYAEVPEKQQWNRWTTENFSIHSIDDNKGQYLHDNLEKIKSWIVDRWGLNDFKFGKETIQTEAGPKEFSHVKLWCVNDDKTFLEFYGIKDSEVDVRRDDKNIIQTIEVFLLLNENFVKDVPIPLTEVVFTEFEQVHDFQMGFWAHRGMGLLNGTIPQIKEQLVDLSAKLTNDKVIFLSKELLNVKKSEYLAFDDAKKALFDQEAMVLCLLLRKEFGQDRFHYFLYKSFKLPEETLKVVYEFENYDQFDASFFRYAVELTNDVKSGKTPNQYLNIVGAK